MTAPVLNARKPPPESASDGKMVEKPPRETATHRFRPTPSSHRRRPIVLSPAVAISFVLCLMWHFTIGDVNLRAQAAEPEFTAKAKTLALLPDYVRWPGPASATLTVGILGDDPFAGALDKMNPKRSKSIEDLKGCQIVFISNSEKANIGAIIEALAGANVLTVGESEGFAKLGGVIGFVIEGDQVRFEVNTGAARQAGLKLDLRLLKLAVRVFNS